jgi:asparagine synthase (glutamine-hydrolysing)
MCGISGFVNFNNQKPSRVLIKKMTDVIAHRGPDDQGQEIIGPCALGNRRLSVIDLSPKAHMPMWDDQKRFCISYNGEVYNYKKLRSDLIKKGYKFRSDSDTEVVLNLFKAYQHNSIQLLRGMFALAIWDSKEKSLFLARDQFGIKPLHYYQDKHVFIFSSEIKSILLHPNVKKQVNTQALSHYFSLGFGCIGSPQTIFNNIYKLPPAHYAILKNNNFQTYKYWDFSSTYIEKTNFDQAVLEGRRLIEDSVKDQLVSDVPLGTFLSGGLDSSLITALAQKNTKRRIETYSIGFTDKNFDESKYALQVAKYLNTDHHHKIFTNNELLDLIPQVFTKLDEPLGDASILPTYLLSQFTKQGLTVSLSGDGGDELFAGYPTFIAHKFGRIMSKFDPKFIKKSKNLSLKLLFLLKYLPILKHSPNFSTEFKAKRFFNGLNRDLAKQYLNFTGPFNLNLKDKLIKDHKETAVKYVQDIVFNVSQRDWATQVQYLDFMIYMGEDCLLKVDRASNFNSLEVRPPLLNVELTEYAFSLPSKFKFHFTTPKYILKKIAQPYLPQNIINRPKKGFGIPVHQWLKKDLKPLVSNLLDKNRLEKQNLFDASYVQTLIKEHDEDINDHRMVLWNLLAFQLWWDNWMK